MNEDAAPWYAWNISELGDLFVEVGELPDGLSGFLQLLFLGGVYGMVLMYAADMIGNGSELLLLVPSMKHVVGSVVLPVLGAVPDGCIVLFAGLGPDAQEQLSVGVGALAGSTVMLLTLPWYLSIYAGRVNIVNGVPDYKGKLNPPDNMDLMTTGVGLSKNVKIGSYIMMATCLSYLLLQLPAMFAQMAGNSTEGVAAFEHGWSFLGMITSFGMFIPYLNYMANPNATDEVKEMKQVEVERAAIRNHTIGIRGLVYETLTSPEPAAPGAPGETTALKGGSRSIAKLRVLLKPFFSKYDADKNGYLDPTEIKALFADLGENPTPADIKKIFSEMDADNSGQVTYTEFVDGVAAYVTRLGAPQKRQSVTVPSAATLEAGGHADEDDDEEEMPEDLEHLSPEEQQAAVKKRAGVMLAMGTVLVVLFSDPMVDVLSELGVRTGIPAFYVSFMLAPLAANLSEVMASFQYAAKKSQNTIDISLSTLQGACAMNNTFVLGIFMILIYFRSLAWQFFAETFAILLVQVIIAILAQKSVHTMFDAYTILSLFPLAIIVVAVLESMGFD